MARELEEWGGEVRVPGWVRRVLRRPPPPGDTDECRAERPAKAPGPTVGQNTDRAAAGAVTDIFWEGRRKR